MWQSTFPPRGKQELQVNFPVFRGKWHEVPKGGRPPPRRKVALSVAKRRIRSHILKHDASSTANAVPLPRRGKALKYRQKSKKILRFTCKRLRKSLSYDIISVEKCSPNKLFDEHFFIASKKQPSVYADDCFFSFSRQSPFYSHSMVAGGLQVTS